MTPAIDLGVEAAIVLSIYLAAVLAIGFVAKARTPNASQMDYFLGGKATGAVLLFFTMQATQYSGNAFFGFTGMGYRNGLIWILSVPLIGLIITAQLSFAPRLYVLSRKHHYLTPADYYAHRFASPVLRQIVAVLTIVSMFPYLMIQAEATGHAFVALSSGTLPFWSGVVFITTIMAVYISVGGFKGVIWTDALQGVLLTTAMLAVTVAILTLAGGLGSVIETLDNLQPMLLTAPGDVEQLTSRWLSLLIVSAIGFSMYPQAIQRIYAARSESALKKSFMAMLGVPFLLGACTLLIGISGAVLHPGLIGADSDQIFGLLLSDLSTNNPWLVTFVLCGLLAAIMSTSSSVVLTLASIFTRDIYQSSVRKQAGSRELARVGQVFIYVLLLAVVLSSLNATTTLWRLTEIKIEFLMQLFPPLVLGLYWRRVSRNAAICGILSGCFVAGAMMLGGYPRWWLFQAGLYGFLMNLLVCVVVSLLSRPSQAEQERLGRDFFGYFR